jgi:hypothetical protein
MVGNTGRTADPRRIRRLRPPRAFEVEADLEGVPLRINLGSAWQDVTLARKPWRIDQHWWRDDHVQREYFRVAPEDGPPLTVYHDLVSGAWARQEY